MINAREELLEALTSIEKTPADIVAFNIALYTTFEDEPERLVGTSLDLNTLNFIYDNGYDSQYLVGIIVFDDNTWLTRREYDGSEWWTYHKCPTVADLIGE